MLAVRISSLQNLQSTRPLPSGEENLQRDQMELRYAWKLCGVVRHRGGSPNSREEVTVSHCRKCEDVTVRRITLQG